MYVQAIYPSKVSIKISVTEFPWNLEAIIIVRNWILFSGFVFVSRYSGNLEVMSEKVRDSKFSNL